MKHHFFEIFLLSVFFLILSEAVTPINLLAAVAISTLIIMFKGTLPVVDKYVTLPMAVKWVKYILVLFVEVVKANFQVAKIALSPKMDIGPHIVSFESKLKDPALLTVLANSITLTPGTMTVEIEGNKMLIHCLNSHYAEGLKNMHMEQLLCEIEGELNG